MKSKQEFHKHRVRFISHSLTAVLLCIAAFVWAPKNIYMSYALLGAAGLYGMAARREMHKTDAEVPKNSDVVSVKFGREIFKT